MKISGHMDLCGPELIEGWLHIDTSDGEPLKLQVYVDGLLLGECSADRFRRDLQEAGYGDGRCGFSFAVPEDAAIADFTSTKLRLGYSPVYLLPSDDTAIALTGTKATSEDLVGSNSEMRDLSDGRLLASPELGPKSGAARGRGALPKY